MKHDATQPTNPNGETKLVSSAACAGNSSPLANEDGQADVNTVLSAAACGSRLSFDGHALARIEDRGSGADAPRC
jgi:hypothetical protein